MVFAILSWFQLLCAGVYFFILSNELKDGAELTDDPSLRDPSTPSVAKSVSLFSIFAPVK